MELNEIKKLLEKYYEGVSSLEEEQLLKDIFRYRPVPAELEADKELFLYMASHTSAFPIDSQLEQKLTNWIDQQDNKGHRSVKIIGMYRMVGIAASFAILIICYLTFFQPKDKVAIKDTYKDPTVAYAQAKRTLLYVSQQLNKGTAPLGQVNKLNQLNKGINRLSSLSSLNNGIEQLQLVSKYYDTSKKENNEKK